MLTSKYVCNVCEMTICKNYNYWGQHVYKSTLTVVMLFIWPITTKNRSNISNTFLSECALITTLWCSFFLKSHINPQSYNWRNGKIIIIFVYIIFKFQVALCQSIEYRFKSLLGFFPFQIVKHMSVWICFCCVLSTICCCWYRLNHK